MTTPLKRVQVTPAGPAPHDAQAFYSLAAPLWRECFEASVCMQADFMRLAWEQVFAAWRVGQQMLVASLGAQLPPQ